MRAFVFDNTNFIFGKVEFAFSVHIGASISLLWGNLGESGSTVQVYRSFRVCTIPVLLTCLQHLIVRFQSYSHAYNIGLHEFSPTHMLTTSDCTTSVPLTVMMLTTSDCTISVLLTCLQHLIARFQSYSHAYNI
jgi:hypothetical protein